MSAAGWQVTDSANRPNGNGWAVSDSPTPPASLDLSNKLGQGLYQMAGPDGKVVPVPYGQVQRAAQQGYAFANDADRWRFAKDNAADPRRSTYFTPAAGDPRGNLAYQQQMETNLPAPMQAIAGVAKGAGTVAAPFLHAVAAATGGNPQDVSDMLTAHGPIQTVAKVGTIGAAVIPAAVTAPIATVGGFAGGAIGAGAGQVIGDISGMSPNATQLLSDSMGMAGGAAGAEGAQAATPGVKAFAGKIFPSLLDAPESLLTRAIKPGKNNTAWTTDVQTAIPLIKSAEQQLGKPITGIDDALEAANIAKKDIWQQYQQRLGPAAEQSATIDGNQIADAMVNSIDKRTALQNPALTDQIASTADTYRRDMSLPEAEDFLQSNNAELNSYYAKNKVARNIAERDPETAYKVAEGDALRDALYSKLDQVSGPGAAQLKSAYGSLTNIQKELYGRKLVYDRQAPVNLGEQLGYLQAGGKILSGNILGGVKDIALRRLLSEMNDTNSMITRAFDAAQPAQPFPQPSFRSPLPADRQLPAQSGAPTILPYYPQMTPGEQSAAMMHNLRNNPGQQLALPAQSAPIPLPASGDLWKYVTGK